MGVLDEGDPVPLRRDPQARKETPGLVKHLPDRIFDAVSPLDGMDYGELLAVRRPVGRANALEDFPGSTSRERHAGERPEARLPAVLAAERDRHLAGRRDRQDSRRKDAERPGLGAADSCREDLAWLPVPGGGIDDCLAVGSKARAR